MDDTHIQWIDWAVLPIKERINLWLAHSSDDFDFWARVKNLFKSQKLKKHYGQQRLF